MANEHNSGTAAETAKKAVHEIKETGKDAVEGAKSLVGDAMTDLKAAAATKMDSVREAVAEEGERIAATLRDAAEDHGQNSVQGKVLGSMAGGVSSVSETMRDNDVVTLFEDVQTFARRNPTLFVLGAALAGLWVVRIAAETGRKQRSGARSDMMPSASPGNYSSPQPAMP